MPAARIDRHSLYFYPFLGERLGKFVREPVHFRIRQPHIACHNTYSIRLFGDVLFEMRNKGVAFNIPVS